MQQQNYIKQVKEGVLLRVLALPRASLTELSAIIEDRCKIRVMSPPVDGKANAALCQYLSKVFKLPKSSVILVQGQNSKQKVFLLSGLQLNEAELVIAKLLSKRK